MKDVVRLLAAANDPDPSRVLDAIVELSRAERGFLVLRRDGELVVRTARHMDREEIARAHEKVSRTILERALAEGRPIVASDADIAAAESLQGQKVRSVCAIPLRRCEGAIYLDHRFEKGVFADLVDLDAAAAELDRALHARGAETFGGFIGRSKPMKDLYRVLSRVAESPYPVLVCGESGTGKELVARSLHRQGPFVAANCAVLPEQLLDSELFGHVKGAFTGAERDRAGLFEQARGGTLFLDEIACLSLSAQESFLRVLETGEIRRLGAETAERVQVRVIAATHEDLELSEGFRRDLYYRLNVLKVDLPPLRERLDDLPLLAAHFLDRIAAETGRARQRLTEEALGALASYRWPGNVRELLNALRRAAALSDRGILEGGDFAFLKGRDEGKTGEIVSIEEHIRAALVRWSESLDLQQIADRLGLSRKTLWEKKKKFGL